MSFGPAGLSTVGTALPFPTIRNLDEKALELARGGVRLRLALGEALDVFATRSLHHELGFSSLSAYALERCELGARFVSDSVAVARLLERNSLVRDQLTGGKLGWSRAELIAKLAERR